MYLARGIRPFVGVSSASTSSWSGLFGGSNVIPSLGIVNGNATSLVIATRNARNEALSYGAAKKKTRKNNRVYPLPAWASNSTELSEAEKLDVWKTVQFLGGKDPLQLLALDMIEQLKESAVSRTYYLPESTRDEIFNLWQQDPIVNSDSALAIRFRLSRRRVNAILILKSREKEQRARGELKQHDQYDAEFDQAATELLSPESDGKMLDDKILLRNRISKPNASQVPAEVNMRVLDRILPVATKNKSWEDQLPKDYRPQPVLHIPSPNKLWKNDTPLLAAYRIGAKPPKATPGETSEKTLTRKLGHAFQTLEPNGKVRKATIWEARQLLGVLRPKRRDRYDPSLDASAEPTPDELAVEDYKNSLNPDQIHLARFWRTLSKTWDVEQQEIESQVDQSEDPLNVAGLVPGDLMAFEKDQFAYLHHVKRAVTKNWSGNPRGVRTLPGGPRTSYKMDVDGNFVEVEDIGPIDERKPTASGDGIETVRQKVKAKKNETLDAVAGVGARKKQSKVPKAKTRSQEIEFEPAVELTAEEIEARNKPVTYDTSGDVWAKPRAQETHNKEQPKQIPKLTRQRPQQKQQQEAQAQAQPHQQHQPQPQQHGSKRQTAGDVWIKPK